MRSFRLQLHEMVLKGYLMRPPKPHFPEALPYLEDQDCFGASEKKSKLAEYAIL